MKKKLLTILLIGTITCSLAACGGGNPTPNKPSGNTPSNSQTTNESTDKNNTGTNNDSSDKTDNESSSSNREQIDLTDLINVNVASSFNGNIPLPICKDTELSSGSSGAGDHVKYLRRIEGSTTGMGKNYDEVFSLTCTQDTQQIDAATAFEKITKKYNSYSKDSEYTNVEIFGDTSTPYIAVVADQAEIFKNGVYWELKQKVMIYDASSSTTYTVDFWLIKNTELFGEGIMDTAVKPYLEKIHDTLEQLCK